MHLLFRWGVLFLAVGLLAPAAAWGRDIEKPGGALPDPTSSPDTVVYQTLRDVINRGADLYNSGDMAGCYRLFEGALRTVKPMLGHKPELQKAIDAALVSADRDPVVWRRAFTLRSALDKVRAELNPKKNGTTTEVKPAKVKTPEDTKPEGKKPEDTETIDKKPKEKDGEGKKPIEKEPDDKKFEDAERIEKRPKEKPPSDG